MKLNQFIGLCDSSHHDFFRIFCVLYFAFYIWLCKNTNMLCVWIDCSRFFFSQKQILHYESSLKNLARHSVIRDTAIVVAGYLCPEDWTITFSWVHLDRNKEPFRWWFFSLPSPQPLTLITIFYPRLLQPFPLGAICCLTTEQWFSSLEKALFSRRAHLTIYTRKSACG